MNSFHLGIYGVILKNGSILLVNKSRGPYTGLLDLPGGKPEHAESIFHTLYREIQEETGIVIATSSLFDNRSITVNYNENGYATSLHHTGLIYLIDEYDDSAIRFNTNNEDVMGAGWHKIEDVQEAETTPFADYAIKALKNNPILW